MDDLDIGATITGLAAGQKVFNRYTLTHILGRGGMGVVWRAHDDKLERDIALKFLPEVMMGDKLALAELKRETRRSLELTHSHIVRIYDFVEDARTAAIAMEYIAGDTLTNARVERPGHCYDPADLRGWVTQLCSALEYAHTKAKVVHRDLKPANLMIDAAGDLKVTDFGIASSIADSVSRVSREAGSSGTPVYMSPQQMMGEKPSVADDVYALGATLYDLLTGKPPFYSGNIIIQVQNKVPPSLAERRAELEVTGAVIPAAWEETIAACLAKEAADRPQSAAELTERLELGSSPKVERRTPNLQRPTSSESPGPTRPGPESDSRSETTNPRSRIPAMAGIAAGLVILGLAGWYFGLHVPEQKRLAEIARLERTGQELEAVRLAVDREELHPNVNPKKKPHFTIPGLNLEMRHIEAGSFQMGSANSNQSDERPVTQARITKAYWLGATEVTQGQWEAVMGNNPSNFGGSNLPVERVSYDDALSFCRKLTERERSAGRLPEGYVYTLPTEAQWEYACRAGTTGDYAGSLDAMGWYTSNSADSTEPVGTKQANAWGLYDMHGNVWEWCLDWEGDYPGGNVTDPIGASSGSNRVNRGGSWLYSADNCRSAYRDGSDPGFRGNDLGFRLALSSVR